MDTTGREDTGIGTSFRLDVMLFGSGFPVFSSSIFLIPFLF